MRYVPRALVTRPLRAGTRVALPSAAVSIAALGTLFSGVALKGDCFGHGASFWRSRPCYTDIQPLYYGRGINEGQFPYIHAVLSSSGRGTHGFNEYPVLTGLFMWATGLPVSSGSTYLALSIALLAIASLATTWLLWCMAGPATLNWAASPILVLYAFQNWDLLAVSVAVAGFYMWLADRPLIAAALFGIGAAFKLYPALFILPVAFDQLTRRDRLEAIRVAVVGVGTFAAINLPIVLINPDGWLTTYRFHADRAPMTSGTIWSVLDPHISTTTENHLSEVSLVAAWITIAVLLEIRRRSGRYPVMECSAAALAMFVVLNKVSSPQYLLWVVPFLALVPTRRIWWYLLSLVAVGRFAAEFGVNIVGFGTTRADELAKATVLLQAVLLILFAYDAITLPRTGREPHGMLPVRPPALPPR